MLIWIYYFLLLVLLITGWTINILGLPGLWLMLIAHIVYAWATGWDWYTGTPAVLVLFALTALAEVIEFVAGAAGSKSAGGTKIGMIGAIIGGFVGGLIGTGAIPVPIVGTILGAVGGSFIGAGVIEKMVHPDSRRAFRIAVGAAKGRFLGIVIKSGVGIVMGIVSLAAALPLGPAAATYADHTTDYAADHAARLTPGDCAMKSESAAPPSLAPAYAAGVGTYFAWGFIAEYFQLLINRGVSADVLLANRIIWSTAFCVLLLLATRNVQPLLQLIRDRRRLLALLLSSFLVAVNWLSFIYAIQTHQRTEAALGYFVNPLMSVAMGVILLGERLSRVKWLCVSLAFVGVTMIVVASGGRVPWIAIFIALSFGFYGLVRKRVSVEPLLGLTIETALLLPIALAYLAWHQSTHPTITAPATWGLLMLAGVITAIPLLWFGYAARHLPLGTLGFLQYLTPTCQLLMAVLLRGEPIRHRIGGFILIWVALALFTLTTVRWRRDEVSAEPGG